MTSDDREQVRRYVARLDARRGTLEDELEDTAKLARGRTPQELDRDLQQVVRAGWAILMSREDKDRVLAWRDPLPEHSRLAWRRLVERYRSGHEGER